MFFGIILSGCGGEADLTDAERAAMQAQIAAIMASTMPQSTSRPTKAVNSTDACAVSGKTFTTGNVTVNCTGSSPPITCTYSDQVKTDFGSPTNNLEDCEVAADVFLDGTIYTTLSGQSVDANIDITMTMNGNLETARRGPTGGLIPNGSCSVNLTFRTSTMTLSGSFCGTAINI